MYKIIGADRKEYGPVSADQVRQWIREGRANAQTQVQPQDGTDWKPLGSIAEFAALFAPPPPDAPSFVPNAEVVLDNPAADGSQAADEAYRLSAGECLARGWELFKAHVGMLVGACLIVMLISLLCGTMPVLGIVMNVILSGPLLGGLYLLNLKLLRGEDASIGDVFEGFNRCFSQLMLGQIMVMMLTLLGAMVFIVFYSITLVFRSKIILLVCSPIAFAGLLPAIYLAVCWAFTLPLIIDKNLDFWSAMELSRKKVGMHFWPACALVVIGGIVTLVSSYFIIGALIVLPIYIASVTQAYEDLFNPR